jgi:hypothetical protein
MIFLSFKYGNRAHSFFTAYLLTKHPTYALRSFGDRQQLRIRWSPVGREQGLGRCQGRGEGPHTCTLHPLKEKRSHFQLHPRLSAYMEEPWGMFHTEQSHTWVLAGAHMQEAGLGSRAPWVGCTQGASEDHSEMLQ